MVNTILQRLTNKVDRIQLERLVLPYLTRLKDENVIDSVIHLLLSKGFNNYVTFRATGEEYFIFEILPRVVAA
jgi:hypothetical protein